MKKIVVLILIIVLLMLLFVPIPTGVYKDGGTRVYTSLTYKIVDWNRISETVSYDKTRVYIFPYNFKSLDDLWEYESDNADYKLIGKILEIYDGSVLVAVDENMTDLITFGTEGLEKIDIKIGSEVEIVYDGVVMESYPGQIFARSWKLCENIESK